jgi:hypothetical protein
VIGADEERSDRLNDGLQVRWGRPGPAVAGEAQSRRLDLQVLFMCSMGADIREAQPRVAGEQRRIGDGKLAETLAPAT